MTVTRRSRGRAALGLALATLLISGAAAPSTAFRRSEFAVVDVFLATSTPLAAWQIELRAQHSGLRLVGVENGEARAFIEAPHYDPKALGGGRIILAAFSTEEARRLPTGRVRVATLHVQRELGSPLHFDQRVIALADASGNRIDGTLSVEGR